MSEGGKFYESTQETAEAPPEPEAGSSIPNSARAMETSSCNEHWVQSGFANTDVDAQLKQGGIQKIILVGFIANTCVESTGRFGMELGYHVTLIKDPTAAFSPEGMHTAHEVDHQSLPEVLRETVCFAISSPALPLTAPRPLDAHRVLPDQSSARTLSRSQFTNAL